MIEGAVWETARSYPYGILTGRIPEEMRLAARLLGLPDEPGSDHVITDDGRFPAKPDPSGLLHLASYLRARPLYYFGDNRDDLLTLRNAETRLKRDGLLFVGCLTGVSDPDTVFWFASSGAAMLAAELSDALSVLLPVTPDTGADHSARSA